MRRKLAAGNWKMHGDNSALDQVEAIAAGADPAIDLLICPPATLLHRTSQTAQGRILIGGQDCHPAPSGAHTGDISAAMLKDAGATHVILGHSERRADHGEHSEQVRAKARTAMSEGLITLICLGESLEQRNAANTLDIIAGQLSGSVPDAATGENLVIAYEPVWAIGTGRVPTPEQIGEVHSFIRARLESRFGTGVGRSVRLLYGGSVKPENCTEIFRVGDVDGALVGGASLTADSFLPIARALAAA